ncbi:bifunctional 2-polyprenyl-6-hydroxyphenol methylase/3-demethylubiquinol 3-O-methyltransferase UbiG [Lysinibacillus sp. BPa_S21]|uniref:class I SAM-dependent methyltransferase n=1 Tax=Lysinibacillus sp. BPa_S21 TaxID=2932478 RepID=UPI0020119B6A|nr:class I SAM-dependent methyltransferase [Lysinibacillus sp. BPa_S21]MCL1694795.1 class I SAM-dependent methyltransferase [Lysinibacillus sp. BPa_S21]
MKQNIYDHPEFFHQYQKLRQASYNFNNLLEQPALKSLLPNLTDLQILDIGCGMGEFAYYCIENNARHVTAIDVSKNMLAIAQREHAHQNIDYYLQAIEDFRAVIRNIASMLRPGSLFIFSVEHPIVTARKTMEDNWIYDSSGRRSHYAMDHYHDEGIRERTWFVDGVVKYHRSMSTIINTLIAYDLTIEKMLEPLPDSEAIPKLPSLEKEHRRPSFLLIRARK